MSLEMAQKVIVPQKKNYVPQFLKQRDINSYKVTLTGQNHFMRIFLLRKVTLRNYNNSVQ
jgi:hypothetical protein